MTIIFTIPGQPQGKGRAKVSTRGGFARAYTPEKTAAYENLIKLSYGSNPKLEGYIAVTILAYYAIPKSFSKAKTAQALSGKIRPTTKPDVDNIAKVVCDALNKIAYDDDSQIISLVVMKSYAQTPRVAVILNGEAKT